MLTGLNHITFAVADIERSFSFYSELLGFKPRAKWAKGAYFSIAKLWFCITQDENTRTGAMSEYTHLAFTIDAANFAEFSKRILGAGCVIWKQNMSEGLSLYFLDPDGHKLELHVGNLKARLDSAREQPWEGLEIFD